MLFYSIEELMVLSMDIAPEICFVRVERYSQVPDNGSVCRIYFLP